MMSRMQNKGTGPLAGVKVVEMAGIGPARSPEMMLADFGADVIRIDRPGAGGTGPATTAVGCRSPSISRPRRAGTPCSPHPAADMLIEGFRPGVMESSGSVPTTVRPRNPGLIYGRMTGWGQEGPLADRAGHDINYIGVAGALAHFGRHGEPPRLPAEPGR